MEWDTVCEAYRVKDQHFREKVDSSVRSAGGQSVECLQCRGLGLGEQALDGGVRGDVADILQGGGTQQVSDHLKLRERRMRGCVRARLLCTVLAVIEKFKSRIHMIRYAFIQLARVDGWIGTVLSSEGK